MQEILSAVDAELFGVWFLIGAALVFWMQAGFAMVEGGFTRAKNAGNIIMKNLMDFCIGTVMFMLIGFSLLLGEDYLGFIGKPGFDLFTNFANFNFSTFVPVIITWHPDSINDFAIAYPIPPEPPVISATFLSSTLASSTYTLA